MKMLLLLFLLVLADVFPSLGQSGTTQIEIVNANTLEGRRVDGKEIRRLIGNVIFKQDEIMMYCDSAYQYAYENKMDAFGSVRILQGDSLKLYGNLLKYDGNKKQAVMYENIRMTDGQMVLTSDNLNYNLSSRVASFVDGGKIVDGSNVLTTKRGNYFAATKNFVFRDSVVLVNPEYILSTDTLKYNTNSEIAYFLGPCKMQSRTGTASTMYCNEGWYNSKTGESVFMNNARVVSRAQSLSGDSIFYSKISSIGKSYGNVKVVDTTQNITVMGNYGEYHEKENYSFITGNTLLTQQVEADSMFLHADTLYAVNDSAGAFKYYYAFNSVKIFKSDLQGKCDSLVYSDIDSSISFFGEPVIWSSENQLTATFIKLQLSNNKVYKMYLEDEAFIASEEVEDKYNQIRGKEMTGHFIENELRKIDVSGNGQTIYYGVNSKREMIGVNRADCSDLVIYVNDSKVDKITLIDQPSATFYPPNELKSGELLLKGFTWQQDRRPLTPKDVFRW